MSDQSLSQQLFSQLQGEPMQKIAQQLGTSTEQASSAVSQALPLMMGALGNQAQQGGQGAAGIASMLGALGGGQGGSQAGSLGDILGGLLGGSGNAAGGGLAGALGGLVGSVLGGGQSAGNTASSTSAGNAGDLLATVFGNQGSARAAEGLGQSTGLGTQGAGNLLGMLLPIVMSFLRQRFLQGGNGTQQLDQALANERQQLNNQGAGGALASLLDQNGDGKLDMNDLVKLGSSLLGGKR